MSNVIELLDFTVNELPHEGFTSISSEGTLLEAATLMQNNKIGSVLVLGKDQELQGIITERDFLTKVTGKEVGLKESLRPFMTKNPKTIMANESVVTALCLMTREGFRHLPVVDMENRPVGVISIRDIMTFFASHLKS